MTPDEDDAAGPAGLHRVIRHGDVAAADPYRAPHEPRACSMAIAAPTPSNVTRHNM